MLPTKKKLIKKIFLIQQRPTNEFTEEGQDPPEKK